MKLYVGSIDKSFKSILLNNAYEYAKCFNGKNRLELISKKSLLDKSSLIMQKYDPNYLFSCLVKENLDKEDEKIISISNDTNLIAYLLFHRENGIVIDNIVIADYLKYMDLFKSSFYNYLISEVENYSQSIYPSIVYINPYFNDELLNDILSKRGYISDVSGLKKLIYVPKENRKKGIIYIEDYERSNFSKQR